MNHRSRTHKLLGIFFALGGLMMSLLPAQVKYDEGRMQIEGVQLLQDYQDSLRYYYLPQYPRLATNEEGNKELLCLKYIGEEGKENGGIFHALFEFSLPAEVIETVATQLKRQVPGARIAGPVPLQQSLGNGENTIGGFQVISSILNDQTGEQAFTQKMIASGHAPLLPGSKAAVAARLNQEGATLLWESMQGATSDVSVGVHAEYEAVVKGYNAVVKANVSQMYTHYSEISNNQKKFTKTELRDITDKLVGSQTLHIESFDRSASLDLDNDDMEKILSLVTEKLTALMFDAETGWAQKPEQETAVEEGQIPERHQRGWLGRLFRGKGDQKYISDNQYVLKERSNIQTQQFYLNLSKSTTVKVPVYTSGNLGGIFTALGEDERYFRIVRLDDPDFQIRDVHVQVDGAFVDAFDELINYVTVSFRKQVPGEAAFTKELVFRKEDLAAGKDLQAITYPRQGIMTSDWLTYEIRTGWSLKGREGIIRYPADSGKWFTLSDPAISLSPPFKKKIIEIDADRDQFKTAHIQSARIKFFSVLGDEPVAIRTTILRIDDPQNTQQVALYYDTESPMAYQISWFSHKGTVIMPAQELDDEYLFLQPPTADQFAQSPSH